MTIKLQSDYKYKGLEAKLKLLIVDNCPGRPLVSQTVRSRAGMVPRRNVGESEANISEPPRWGSRALSRKQRPTKKPVYGARSRLSWKVTPLIVVTKEEIGMSSFEKSLVASKRSLKARAEERSGEVA